MDGACPVVLLNVKDLTQLQQGVRVIKPRTKDPDHQTRGHFEDEAEQASGRIPIDVLFGNTYGAFDNVIHLCSLDLADLETDAL